jgi:TonB family protein
MMQLVIDHLWQSTLFALAAGLVTLTLRNNTAGVRYWVWFAASIKFLVPFSLLARAGAQLGFVVAPPRETPIVAFMMDMTAVPVPTETSFPIMAIIAVVWVAGSLCVLGVWALQLMRITALVRSAEPSGIAAPLAVKFVKAKVEPGLVGIGQPILLMPAGIASALTPAEMQSILAHEVCHLRRRDNLTAAAHMLVQALFWFHPLTWWIGGKLVEERERACDEAVVGSGNEPSTYAEAILKVCRFYVRSPLICASGVSGADLKQRVEEIMMNRKAQSLSVAKKVILSAAAIAALATPIVLGWTRAPEASSLVPVLPPTHGFTAADVLASPALPYDEFLAAVERGDVDKIMVIEAHVMGNYADGRFFQTDAPKSLWNDHTGLAVMRANGVTIMVPPRGDPSRPNIGAAGIYPAESKAAKEEGSAVLNLTVDETGDVAVAEIAQSTGFERLDLAAVAAAESDWRFMPGRVNGEPAVMQMKIKINFKLDPDEPAKSN